MHEKLLDKIDKWYDEGEHQKIVDAVEAVPKKDWDYQLTGMYIVALNNTNRYEDAIEY